MAVEAEWYKELKERLKQTPEYQAESIAFDIAIFISEYLKKLNMTQNELAQRLNVSRSYISQILRGKTNMTILTMAKLANVLNLKLDISIIYHERTILDVSMPRIPFSAERYSETWSRATGAIDDQFIPEKEPRLEQVTATSSAVISQVVCAV